jgi:hypothetical protein
MSHRPNKAKKLRALRKAIARTPLPAYIDLVQYLKDRRYAQTTGQANRLILAGRVKSESHRLGVRTVKVFEGGKVIDKDVVDRYVPASFRPTIRVVKA